MTIGDVLAVVFFLAGAGLAWWALLISSALLWHNRAAEAHEHIEAQPWRVLRLGIGATVIGGVLIALLANFPNGAVKLLGWGLFFLLLGIGALGGGALASLGAARLRRACPDLSSLGAVSRASALLVGAQFVPLLGWFVLLPLTFLMALGADCHALSRLRKSRARPITTSPTSPVAPNGEMSRLEVWS